MNDYDAVVVGAGLGGLAAAGFLGKAGLRVCLVERADAPGGCVAALRVGSYTLDPAVGTISRGVEDELRDGILAHLGARERCELIPLDLAYRVVGYGVELDVPVGLDAMIDAHSERFPSERAAIDAFFRTCNRILEDTHRLPLLLRFDQLDELAKRFPTFVRYRSATLTEALGEFFVDDAVKRVVAASWPWAGVPPERLSFSTFAQGLALLAHGTYAVGGSFSRLADALAEAFVDGGGTLLLSSEAARITTENERASGVELVDGRRLDAPAVVSNADATTTFERLLGRPAPRLEPSVSATVVFTTAEEGDDRARDTFVADDERGTWITESGSVAAVRMLTEWGSVRSVDDAVDVVATLTPADFAARTGNREGAIYGWANTPRQTGSRRPAIAAPVAGLYLAGHWTQPGHGVYRAILSGMHAARALLTDAGEPDAVPEFRARA